ncbi:hypothetical protein V8G54_018975 [Vigna mungo]|uniref:Histone-lysine N-methyltransferase CLF-like HTH domain-containing protein n=1 Tax=Vigna mungo TaxID=3915 RepID=A0AAQ3RV68_VIGMU
MAEDQSVIGKEQMYYDINSGEMVICSDSEEEIVNLEDVKYDFTEAQDQFLWKTLNEYGSNENVLSIVKEFVKTTSSQIQERFEKLQEIKMQSGNKDSKDCHCRGCESDLGMCLEKGLSASSQSLDNLFCRHCLVNSKTLFFKVLAIRMVSKDCNGMSYNFLEQIFNCPVHGNFQPLEYPKKKQKPWSGHEGDRQPCGDQCALLSKDVRLSSAEGKSRMHDESFKTPAEHASKLTVSGSSNHGQRDEKVGEQHAKEITSNLDWKPLERDLYLKGIEMFGKNSCLIARNLLSGLKTCSEVASYMFAEEESMLHGSMPLTNANNHDQANAETTDTLVRGCHCNSKVCTRCDHPGHTIETNSRKHGFLLTCRILILLMMFKRLKILMKMVIPFKEQLADLLPEYLAPRPFQYLVSKHGIINIHSNLQGDEETPRSQLQRKRGKYSRKCGGLSARWRKKGDGQKRSNTQYTPCGCQGICSKECTCHRHGVQSFAETGSEDVIVPRVNAEVNYAHALQSTVNVTQIFVEIVGLGQTLITSFSALPSASSSSGPSGWYPLRPAGDLQVLTGGGRYLKRRSDAQVRRV